MGPSYTTSSTAVADEEAINLFPQTVESQQAIVPISPYGGKQAAGLKAYFGTPGLTVFSTFSSSPNGMDTPLRGQCWTGSRLFAVSGDTLYEVFADGSNIALSSVLWNDGKPVSMVASSIQLLVISAGFAYCYTLNPGTWAANKSFAVGALIVDAAGHIQRAQAAAWQASTAYTVGQEIVDPNGNVQQAQQAQWIPNTVYALGAEIVDVAGHIQKAQQAQWAASTLYPLGTEIVDTNGNVQKAFAALWAANTTYALGAQIVDSNGNIQQVTTAGTTGGTVPVWATSGNTADGTVVWTFQAASGGNAGTSGMTVPNWTTGVTLDNGTLVWIYQASAGGKAGTSGASIPTFDDTGGTVGDGTGTLVWADQGAATGAGTSGTAEPIFTTGTTPDANTLVWVFQVASNGLAGISGAIIPTFNDAGGLTLDGTGTLVWQDKGLQLLDVTPQLAGTPVKAEFSDSYFIVIFAYSNKFQMSQVLDGTVWPGLLVNEVEVFSENIVSVIVNHREPWIMGSIRSQPYQDTGSLEVFDVIPGTLVEKGCAATFSPCRVDNSVFWIDSDERGALSAWRSNGYTPTRISTYAVEYDLSTNPQSAIQNMTTYAYEDAGHIFWVLYAPGSSWSWVFDVVEGLWHKRANWNPVTATWGPHFSWNHSYSWGMHLVGDWNTGTLYRMSMNTYQDFGTTIRRLRRSPTVSNEMQRIYHAELTVDFDTGLGPQPPLLDGNGNPRPPQAELRFSDNRGKTWSSRKIAGCGKAGEYQTRVIYRRLGQSRYRVYEVVVSDPIPWAIVDAYLRTSSAAAQP